MSAQPVQQEARIRSLDVLRGVAVLGILLMNIWSFVWPREVHDYPFLLNDLPGATVEIWFMIKVFFEDSQRTIFSILFGAGALLLIGRLTGKADTVSPAKVYYRRTVLLIIFGLINGYIFLWPADILFVYGICGLFLYPVRNWRPRSHLLLALVILAIPNALTYFEYQDITALKKTALSAEQEQLAGNDVTAEEQAAIDDWAVELEKARPEFDEDLQANIDVMSSGSFGEIFAAQAASTLILQTIVALRSFIWDALGAMLLGMVLYRVGFLTLERSIGVYIVTLLLGYGIGIPISYSEALASIGSDFDPAIVAQAQLTFDVGRFSMALGHMSLVLLLCKSALAEPVKRALAATGQMAFTNYLGQSLLGAMIFYGIGFGLYGTLPGYYMYFAVAGIWAFQITFSVWWMGRFRYGPFEWLWRTLTYGRLASASS